MPRCYLLAVSHSSSLDKGTNVLSLFHLVEGLTLHDSAMPPQGAIDVQLHVYWQCEPEEVGTTLEFRVVRRMADGLSEPGPSIVLPLTHRRFRFRTQGLRPPSRAGDLELRVQWRRQGEDDDAWREDPAWWPLDITHLPPAEESAQVADPTPGTSS